MSRRGNLACGRSTWARPAAPAPTAADARPGAEPVRLDPREEHALRRCFAPGGRSESTPDDSGARFAVTRERGRQTEMKALRMLRRPTRPLAIPRRPEPHEEPAGP